MTLEERILWVVERRCAGNQRELSRRAGLKPNHVGTLLTRLRRDPEAGVEADTLLAIARGGDVSLDWLVSGNGDPLVQAVASEEGTTWSRIPGWKEAVADLARRAPTIPPAIFQRLADTRGSWAPSPMTWEWLLVQANHALKGLPDAERLRLMEEQMQRLVDEEVKKDQEAPPPGREPLLPGVEAAPAKKTKR